MNETLAQPGILAPVPALRRSLGYRLASGVDPAPVLAQLQREFDPSWGVVGLGQPLVAALGRPIAGLRPFPALAGPGVAVPSSQGALWVLLNGEDRGVLFDRSETIRRLLGTPFVAADVLDMFRYAGGRDLSGYEDGTENPSGAAAAAAALAEGGASFVAVQRWVHDLPALRAMAADRQDASIGRRRESNEEIDDAPPSAHVKRTAQESFAPPAFMVRRSLPWDNGTERGLEFIAYVAELDRFEAMLRRMAGLEDGIVDALFGFSRPTSGAYYWCPPLAAGRLDLRLLGL